MQATNHCSFLVTWAVEVYSFNVSANNNNYTLKVIAGV